MTQNINSYGREIIIVLHNKSFFSKIFMQNSIAMLFIAVTYVSRCWHLKCSLHFLLHTILSHDICCVGEIHAEVLHDKLWVTRTTVYTTTNTK